MKTNTDRTRPGFINVTLWNDEGDEETHELPARFEVCTRCEGHGTHLNPAIGEHAYSVEEFNEAFDDEESREQYFKRGGIYDVKCEECDGDRVVPVVDEARLTNDQKKVFAEFEKQEQENYEADEEARAEARMERMMGC